MATRAQRIAETYCITLEEYDAILEAQGGVCAICEGKRKYNLDVDHDHALERALLAEGVEPCQARRRSIRGLLCKTCNRRLLRAARDSVEILRNAIEYLGWSHHRGRALVERVRLSLAPQDTLTNPQDSVQ